MLNDERRGHGKGRKRPTGDYQKMADFMSQSASLSIFRRFGNLNVQNLLLLQAELAYLGGTLSFSTSCWSILQSDLWRDAD